MIPFSHRVGSQWYSLALGLVLLITATPVLGQAVYEYEGNHYDTFDGSAFDNTMSVSGSFTIPLALPPNLTLQSIQVPELTFSLSNGLRDFTDANSTICGFEAATGPTGEIVQWNIFLREPGIPAGDPLATLVLRRVVSALDYGDIATSSGIDCDNLLSATDTGLVLDNPGPWTSTTVPVELQTFVIE